MCSCASEKVYLRMQGETMGTYYQVILDSDRMDLQDSINRILADYNRSVSTYDPNSIISSINQEDVLTYRIDTFQADLVEYFVENFEVA